MCPFCKINYLECLELTNDKISRTNSTIKSKLCSGICDMCSMCSPIRFEVVKHSYKRSDLIL